MSKFSQQLSKRITLRQAHKGVGYCAICDTYGPLTADHVPPKCVKNYGGVRQFTLSEYYEVAGVKPLAGKAGNVFKTICGKCNGELLSSFDVEIHAAYLSVCSQFERFLKHETRYTQAIVSVNVKNFVRGVLGHLAAAVPETICLSRQNRTGYVDVLNRFIRYGDEDILNHFDFYIWFYPHRDVFTGNHIGKLTFGAKRQAYFNCIKFFPFGFAVVDKKGSDFFRSTQKLDISKDRFFLDYSPFNLNGIQFPLDAKGMDAYMINEDYCTVATLDDVKHDIK